jgi:hypothetical protein
VNTPSQISMISKYIKNYWNLVKILKRTIE